MLLVGFSILGSTLVIVQSPMSTAMAISLEQNIEAEMKPDQRERFRNEQKIIQEKQNRQERILLTVYLVYLIGFFLALFRGVWGPAIVTIGAVLKVFNESDNFFKSYHILVVVLSIYLFIKWKRQIDV